MCIRDSNITPAVIFNEKVWPNIEMANRSFPKVSSTENNLVPINSATRAFVMKKPPRNRNNLNGFSWRIDFITSLISLRYFSSHGVPKARRIIFTLVDTFCKQSNSCIGWKERQQYNKETLMAKIAINLGTGEIQKETNVIIGIDLGLSLIHISEPTRPY